MNQSKRFSVYVFATFLSVGILVFGFTKINAATPGKVSQCAASGKTIKSIADEAKVDEFSCFFKKWEGIETLHFKVGVTNVSDTPQRFRVNIFLENGKAVGGLIPRKTAKGLVKPGATAGFIYPVSGMPGKPGEVTLIVKTIAQ